MKTRRNILKALLAGAATFTLWPSRSYAVPKQLESVPKIKPGTIAKLRETPGWYFRPVRHIRISEDRHFIEVSYESEPREVDWVATTVLVSACVSE